MNNQSEQSSRASDYLNKILGDAIQAGASSIELERGQDGLEICIYSGATGIGIVLRDRELGDELVQLVVQRAGLEERSKGELNWTIQGAAYVVRVEKYESFGEWCFRLKPRKTKGKSR